MENIWFGNEFQMLEATDENDLEAAMVVLRGGTQIDWPITSAGQFGGYFGTTQAMQCCCKHLQF